MAWNAYWAPEPAAYGAIACPACQGADIAFVGGNAHVAWFACNPCGMDFAVHASDADDDYLFDIHND